MSPAEKKCYFGFDMAKIVNIKLSGDEFFMKSISKIMVPLQSPGFLLYVVEFAIVFVTFVKCLQLSNQNVHATKAQRLTKNSTTSCVKQ